MNAADNGSDFISIPHDIFCECPDESVDYAVMEKTADAVVVGLDADWSDVGSWSALWEVSPKDEQGNVLSGDAWVHNSENCYINSDEKLVAAIGVENLVIVSTKDAVLVMNRERSQDVKKAVEFLKQNQRSEYKRHREIYRPWGRCDVVVQTPRFNVNRITVKPGGAFSMQMHHHRAEHWVIPRRHRPGDGQRQAVPADREPVHLYSDWRRAQPGKPGPYSAGSAGDPVGVVPRRGRHYSY